MAAGSACMSWHPGSISLVQHTLPARASSKSPTMQTAMSFPCSTCSIRARQPFRAVQHARMSCTATRPSASAVAQISARQPCRATLTGRPCGCASLRRSPTSSRAARQQVAAVRAEISYVMIKPDGVQRALVGEVISRFERKGFKLAALKLMVPDKALAEEHYKDLSSKPFFPDLISYIISGPVVAMVWEGDGVVASFRKLVGATDPLKAEPGTVRGDFGRVTGRNIVHASDSPENGEREAALWFKEGLPDSWTPTITPWLVE